MVSLNNIIEELFGYKILPKVGPWSGDNYAIIHYWHNCIFISHHSFQDGRTFVVSTLKINLLLETLLYVTARNANLLSNVNPQKVFFFCLLNVHCVSLSSNYCMNCWLITITISMLKTFMVCYLFQCLIQIKTIISLLTDSLEEDWNKWKCWCTLWLNIIWILSIFV